MLTGLPPALFSRHACPSVFMRVPIPACRPPEGFRVWTAATSPSPLTFCAPGGNGSLHGPGPPPHILVQWRTPRLARAVLLYPCQGPARQPRVQKQSMFAPCPARTQHSASRRERTHWGNKPAESPGRHHWPSALPSLEVEAGQRARIRPLPSILRWEWTGRGPKQLTPIFICSLQRTALFQPFGKLQR